MEFEDPVFNTDNLTDFELAQLKYIIMSPAFERVLLPFFKSCKQRYVNLMLSSDPAVRNGAGGTKYLRAGATNIDVFLAFLDHVNQVVDDQTAMNGRQEVGEADLYRQAVEQGIIRPAGQLPKDYTDAQEF